MMIVAVGSSERVARVLPEVADLLADPLMTLERVRVCKAGRRAAGEANELPEPTTGGSRCGRS